MTNYSPPRGVEANHELLKTIISVYSKAQRQTWDYISDNRAVDLERIYQEFVSQSRLPELYENLIELLQRIIDSNQIDSVDLLSRLEFLVETLKANRKSSAWTQVLSWKFGRLLLKNLVMEGLKKAPGMDVVVVAVEKAMSDLDDATGTVEQNVIEKLDAIVGDSRPRIPADPIVLAIADKSAGSVPKITSK